MKCPCGSGRAFADCCEPYIEGAALPSDAEQLMRSRYTAFTLQRMDYVAATWHPDFRPSDLEADVALRWIGLAVMDVKSGGDEAQVEFEARYLNNGRLDALHERSDFRLEQGRWWYTRGQQLPPTFDARKPTRNESCPCGSGNKFKRCCGPRG